MRKPLSDEEREWIRSLDREGYPVTEIVRITGFGKTTVYDVTPPRRQRRRNPAPRRSARTPARRDGQTGVPGRCVSVRVSNGSIHLRARRAVGGERTNVRAHLNGPVRAEPVVDRSAGVS